MADQTLATMAFGPGDIVGGSQSDDGGGSDSEDSDVPTAWARLICKSGGYDNIEIIEDRLLCGRASDCDAQFVHLLMSGKHCTIFREGGINFIEDTSTNGTWLNGKKIGKGKRRLLSQGDEIRFTPDAANEVVITFIFQPALRRTDEHPLLTKYYDLGDELGSGNFARVRLALHREENVSYAVKCIDKEKFFLQQKRPGALLDEVNILMSVDHENIINLKETFETEKMLFLVLELATGGELFDMIRKKKRFTENEARPLFIQIIQALLALHGRGIAHRDLKPENILLKSKENPIVKLTDFGLSRVMGEGSMMGTMCGTPQYIAPEILANSKGLGYSEQVDMWSAGVILYVMISGVLPFDDNNEDMNLYEQIKYGLYSFPDHTWGGVSEAAKDLCRRLMQVDPDVRWTAAQAIEHPWVRGDELVATPMPPRRRGQDASAPPVERYSGRATFGVMIGHAITHLADVEGSSEAAIAGHIMAHFLIDDDRSAFDTRLRRHLDKMVKRGKLTEGRGGFKLAL